MLAPQMSVDASASIPYSGAAKYLASGRSAAKAAYDLQESTRIPLTRAPKGSREYLMSKTLNFTSYARLLAVVAMGLPSIASAYYQYAVTNPRECSGSSSIATNLGCSIASGLTGDRGSVGMENRPYILLENAFANGDAATGQLSFTGELYGVGGSGYIQYDFSVIGQPGTTAMVSFAAPFSVAPFKLNVPYGWQYTTTANLEVRVQTNLSTFEEGQMQFSAAYARVNVATTQTYSHISPGLTEELSLYDVQGFEARISLNNELGFADLPRTAPLLVDGYISGSAPVRIDADGRGYGTVFMYAETMASRVFLDPYLTLADAYLQSYPDAKLDFDAGVGNAPLELSPVPEPQSLALMALGLGFCALKARGRRVGRTQPSA